MKNKILLSLCLGATILTGCDKFLDLKPLDSQTEIIYFKTPKHFKEAANALHANMYGWQANGQKASANNTYQLIFDWGTDIVIANGGEASGVNVAGTGDVYWEQMYLWLR